MDADLTFSGEVMRCPCVYVWRRGGLALYVGMSRYGLSRPLFHKHEHLRGLLPTDQLEIFLFPGLSSADLLKEECAMIDRLEPSLNGRHRQYMLEQREPGH